MKMQISCMTLGMYSYMAVTAQSSCVPDITMWDCDLGFAKVSINPCYQAWARGLHVRLCGLLTAQRVQLWG